MGKKVIDESNTGVRLIKETLSDGNKVYQIEITKPVQIICTSVDEAHTIYEYLNKLWMEGIE